LKIVDQEFSEQGNTIRYGLVPWDSQIFGFTIVEASGIEISNMEKFDILISSFERRLKDLNCRMVCVKVPAVEKEIFYKLQKGGYVFIEETIQPYIGDLRRHDARYSDLVGSPLAGATGDTIEAIKGIACRTFVYDRFHADKGFSGEKASERYAYWVDNSFNSGDDVLYLDDEGVVRGFSIVHGSGDEAYLALMGVDEGRKGHGLGMELLAATCQHVKDEGFKGFSTVLSLNNIPALNLYSECGFKFKDPVYVLHKWM